MGQRRRFTLALGLGGALVVASVLHVQAITPINTTSTAGIHMLTVPQIQLPGYGVGGAVDIADNGWVALTTGLWEGAGYPKFEVAPIPIPTNPQFTVTAIGADGTLTGNYVFGSGSARRGFVRYPNGTIENLPLPSGYSGFNSVTPASVSDEGYIVGTYQSVGNTCGPTTSGRCSFLASPQQGGGYSVQTLPALPTGSRFTAVSVGGLASTTGIIVGGSGWTWTSGGGYVVLDGGPEPVAGGVAWDVNAEGAIAGYFVPVSGVTRAGYWADRSAAVTEVAPLGDDTLNFAYSLNDADQVVGWSGTSSGASVPRQAFLWDPINGSVPLGELPGGTSSLARGITEDGLVVGTAGFSQVIWDLDGDYDINYPPDLTSITGVNTVVEGDFLFYEFTFADAEGDPFDVVFDGLPVGAVWDVTTGRLEWQTGPGDAGTYPVGMTVEQQGNPVNAFTLVLRLTIAEPLVMDPIGDRGATVGSVIELTPVVSSSTFVYFAATGGPPESPSSLPIGASINSNTGLFSWTPTIDQVGDHEITITANQFSPVSQSASSTFTVTVFEGPVSITINETVTVVDAVAVRLPVVIEISASVTVADSVAVRPPVMISISDSVAVADSVAVRPPVVISISASVTVADSVAVRPPVVISISEGVGVADSISVAPAPRPQVSGRFWVDLDADRTRDANEPGVAGVTIYIDINRNGTRGAGEPSAVTSATGRYSFVDIAPGTFDVRVVLPPGYTATFPTTTHTVTATYGDIVNRIDFGGDPNGVDTDVDGAADGVDGVIDVSGFVSLRTVFSDGFTDRHRLGGLTFGTIVDRASLGLLVRDATSSARGVRVSTADVAVERFASFRFCGRPESVRVRDGSIATFTCGSLRVDVESGLVTVDTADGAVVTVGAGQSALIDEVDGVVTVESLAGTPTVTANGNVTTLQPGDRIENPGGPPIGSELDLAAAFVPLSPVRLFDTRPTEPGFGPKGKVGADTSIDVQVGGRAGVPDDAVAVVMNVTVTEPEGPSFVTAYPTGADRPLASSVNIVEAGQVRPNLVTVKLGDAGMVTLYTLAASHLLADVAGYYVDADAAVSAGRFVPLTPQRLFDTRAGQPAPGPKGKLGSDDTIVVNVLGVGDIPASGVAAVVVNVTGTEAEAPGFVTAFPTGEKRPIASTVNLDRPGATAPNLAIVPIGDGGTISFYSLAAAHLLGDVTGYITDGTVDASTTGLFVPLEPVRVFDTREAESPPGPKGYVGADGSIDVDVAGTSGIPADAAGVVLNVTGTESPLGFLTAWETGPKRPVASTLNFAAPLDTRANAAMLPVGVNGRISFYTLNGSDVLADAAGYFLG